MRFISWLCAFGLLAVSPAALLAQNEPRLKQVRPSYTKASSGAEMYRAYCAACHGLDGKGGGPAAPALKAKVTDLTALARNNHGKYPELRVYDSIRGDAGLAAHGSKDMPVWGDVFRDVGRGDAAEVSLRLRNLTKYIETLQVK